VTTTASFVDYDRQWVKKKTGWSAPPFTFGWPGFGCGAARQSCNRGLDVRRANLGFRSALDPRVIEAPSLGFANPTSPASVAERLFFSMSASNISAPPPGKAAFGNKKPKPSNDSFTGGPDGPSMTVGFSCSMAAAAATGLRTTAGPPWLKRLPWARPSNVRVSEKRAEGLPVESYEYGNDLGDHRNTGFRQQHSSKTTLLRQERVAICEQGTFRRKRVSQRRVAFSFPDHECFVYAAAEAFAETNPRRPAR